MKIQLRHLPIVCALVCACGIAACSGSGNDPGVPDGTLRISADKHSLTADGTDAVSFEVMYGSSDVSHSGDMRLISVLDGKETELPAGGNSFSTTTPGNYTFKARYMDGDKSVISANSVVVDAIAKGEHRQYGLKMLAMQFTSIGCVNCPMMSSTLKLIQEEQPGRLAVAAFHMNYGNYTDPMRTEMSTLYAQKFNVTGLPTCYLNLHPAPLTSVKSSITEAMADEQAKNPADCGVAIATTYEAATRTATVTTKITSNTAESYRYLVLLVEDDIAGMQLGTEESDYRHNNVVRAVLSMNLYGERLNQGAALQPYVECTVSRTAEISKSWNAEKMRVIALALTSSDGGLTYTCSNSNECILGENADYLTNN